MTGFKKQQCLFAGGSVHVSPTLVQTGPSQLLEHFSSSGVQVSFKQWEFIQSDKEDWDSVLCCDFGLKTQVCSCINIVKCIPLSSFIATVPPDHNSV